MEHEEAEQWYLRLNGGDAKEKDRQDFVIWLNEKEANKVAYSELSNIDEILSDKTLYPLESLQCVENKKAKMPIKILLLTAAAMVFCIFNLNLFIETKDVPATAVKSFKSTNELIKLELDDGSILELDAQTEIDVSFTKDTRAVILKKGQAAFQVSTQRNRPFVVHTGSHMVTVLGTVFTVKHKPENGLAVRVQEGLVKVNIKDPVKGTGEVFLERNQMVSWDRQQSKISPATFDSQTEFALWRQSLTKFKEATLEEFFNEFQRYNDFKIHFEDDSLKSLPVSGSFDSRKFSEACLSIEILHGLKCHLENGKLTVESVN